MSGRSPDQMAIVIASRVTVLQLHILSRFFSPERWQSIGSSAPLTPPQERTVSRRRRETTKCASALNARMIFGTAATTATQNFGDWTANHFAIFVTQPFRAIDKLAVQKTHEVRTYTNFTSFRLSCGLRRSKNRETAGIFGTGCVIVIPSHATLSQLPPGQGIRPDTPHQCVRAQCGFRFTSASSPTRSLRSVAGAAASGVISLSIL